MPSRPLIVITDLDGTLLDKHSYRWQAAQPALDALRQRGAAIVLCSSKTQAELEYLQHQIGIVGPLIGENGAAGAGIDRVREVLRWASQSCGAKVTGFGDMSLDEAIAATGLDRLSAQRAIQREWDEPFLVDGDATALCDAIESAGFCWTQGGRFFHIFEKGSKGEATKRLLADYPGYTSIGLGDSENDRSFLEVVDHPIWIRDGRGPVAWNEKVLALLANL